MLPRELYRNCVKTYSDQLGLTDWLIFYVVQTGIGSCKQSIGSWFARQSARWQEKERKKQAFKRLHGEHELVEMILNAQIHHNLHAQLNKGIKLSR